MKTTSYLLVFWLAVAGVFAQQPVYRDKPFVQDYSIKYYLPDAGKVKLLQAGSDRNGNVKVFTSAGLMVPHNGKFLYPGTLLADQTYRTLANKKLRGLGIYDHQFVLLDDKTVLSNAWSGQLLLSHALPDARIMAGGDDFSFLISDGKRLNLLKEGESLWEGHAEGDEIVAIRFHRPTATYWILGRKSLSAFTRKNKKVVKVLEGEGFTAFDLSADGKKAFLGTDTGYFLFDLVSKEKTFYDKLPWTEITAVKSIGEKTWFGTTKGAFALRKDGKFDYYYGERWLPGNIVTHIAEGPEGSVLVLTDAGLGQICFKNMTLAEKAAFYDKQVRSRHIRNGFNASLSGMEKGNLSTGFLSDSDNDGLWTTMYLGGEIFRYAVTKSPEALQNCRESLDAMERLYTVNPVPGFPARSFERRGFIKQLSDPERWQPSQEAEWDWKSTTSSDEVIGHIFAFGAMAELVDDAALKKKAVMLIDTVMSHILKNDLYLIDFDGQPTTWGRWNPEYVNNFPVNVGDRKLNSSNIITMLQTAYHFTRKEKYRKKAFELMTKHGYFENLMRPMKQIGEAPDEADDHAKKMSDAWNHSDDEMYFLGYWGLYRYAFNDTLKTAYRKAIVDHWQAERSEKEGAWNIFTALTGVRNFDLQEAVWYLQEHPLDMIDWGVMNSHRKDLDFLKPNFRKQTTSVVLPPDERPVQRHNANMFSLDRKGGNGVSEHSAGDIWLLPYWLGRYLGVISAP